MDFPSDIVELVALFEARGHAIRIVGGWVRDLLRGLTPKDLDLCTTALPEQMIELCRDHGLAYSDSGLKHGTVGIIYKGVMYEITTLRIDAETDGRHATVEFTADWRADAARRDFTINAMSVDFTGKFYDYFDGVRDIEYHRVRFVGNPVERIREDYLRILRYYRFKGVVEDNLDEHATERAICDTAEGLRQISAERIWSEMSRILSGKNLYNVLDSMYCCRVLEHIGIEDVDHHRIRAAEETRKLTTNPITILVALTDTPTLATRWRMSHNEKTLFDWLRHNRNILYEPAD
jgi:tRNA nucleotidyltransferase (CCA-adding enzyme)